MKRSVLILTTLFILLNLSCSKNNGSPKSDVNLKSGLLVYLDFNGGVVADSSGNNNPAVLAGNGSLSYDEHGNANSAFNGNGDGGRVLVTNNGSIKFDTAFTISCDVMIKSFGTYTFISMQNDATIEGASFGLGTNGTNTPDLNFAIVDTTLGCDDVNSNDNTHNLLPSSELQPDSWYNLIAIFDKGLMQVYVNGKLVGTGTTSFTKANLCPNSQFTIGDYGGGVGNGLNGRMDEVRLYNRSLNADEIAALSKNFQ